MEMSHSLMSLSRLPETRNGPLEAGGLPFVRSGYGSTDGGASLDGVPAPFCDVPD